MRAARIETARPASTGPSTAGSVWLRLASFYALTLALSWGWALPLVAVGDVVRRADGSPTHWPALLGPMLAAITVVAVTQGRRGLRDLGRRMVRWRVGLRWWAWGLGSPLAYFALAAVVARLVDGSWPDLHGLGRATGAPAVGVLVVWLAAIVVNGYGEETGWRGFAQQLLQWRYGGLGAALLIVPFWALWHVPYFALLETYRDGGPAQYPGFVFGLACGSIVLAWLYNGSGGSIAVVAVWHATFNMVGGATDASQGTVAAVVSTAVMVQALVLVALEVRAVRSGRPGVIGPRHPS